MHTIEVILLLLAVVTILAEVANKIKVPHPILLVLVGIVIGLIPWLPDFALSPEVVFLIFLPPVLYAAAWYTSWPDFKAARRPIGLLAIGCVIFTTCIVAWVTHTFIPGFGWAEAFVLGAIISPPDAVAATAATKGLGVPRRVITILEGESLVNDATGLIAYKYAVGAVTIGSFVLWQAGLQFLWVAIAGIGVGLIIGQIFLWVHKITPNNPTTDTTLTFIAPYVSYLLAEEFHLSGVLAVVTSGLFLAWHSSEVFSQQTRLQAYGTWNTILFILNGIIFILIGLQLPVILRNINDVPFSTLLGYGAIVSITVIVVRIIWVFPGTYLPRINKRIRKAEPKPDLRLVSVVAWSGMRGIVSLAAALALPLMVNSTMPFPNRNMIIFLTFCVIFSTLVVQGLTLPGLIKMLGIKTDGAEEEEEHQARIKITSAVIEHIEENYSLLNDELLNQIKTKYEIRIQRLRKDVDNQRLNDDQYKELLKIRQDLLNRERAFILDMRNKGGLNLEILRRLENELDLEETRLILEREAK
ncbi:MAG: Na+/H+ antiporter [Cyclobacteriaceae bacterium]|nr:Na+/H+ antiporter [Cyclobacteriaceae bacterium]